MRDTFPPQRADVKALFGEYLLQHGLQTDLLAEAAAGAAEGAAGAAWRAGQAHLYRAHDRGRLRHLVGTTWFYCAGLVRHSRAVAAIQVRDQVFLALVGLIVARLRGIRFFYWMSFPFPEGYLEMARSPSLASSPLRRFASLARGTLGYHLLYHVVAPRADHVFVQSERMLEVMAARGLRRARMTAVPMGVDLAQVRAAAVVPAQDQRLAGGRPLVYLGALDRARRIDFLFEVLARVRRDIPKALLILAGEATEAGDRDWLRREAQRAGVSQAVVWLGWLPAEQAWRYVKCAEVGLSPIPPGPLYDVSSPTKALEYLALGLPVVGNRIPDQEAVLTASGAGAAVEYDVAAFADAIVRLLLDPALARAMGARGPEFIARERDYAVLGDQVAAVYGGLLAPACCAGPRDSAVPGPGRF
jgi:glycosyltransferase involved in cell wall biosynthesis